jgi:glutathione S-transferase
MAVELYWGSGSPYAWRVLLALEYKQIPYVSHRLEFSKQEHLAPHILKLNPRGRVPILVDGDFVCFESLAIIYYLDAKFPGPALFGQTPEEGATIVRVICEYQAYAEEHINKITAAIFMQSVEHKADIVSKSLQAIAAEARTIEQKLSTSQWLVGSACSAADIMIYPGIQLLMRALERREAQDLRSRLLPLEANFPSMWAWFRRIEALPGYERTYPPHWRDVPAAS